MKKIKVAIIGLGNIGKYAVQTVKNSKDMELVGIVRREVTEDKYQGFKVVSDISKLEKVDVALLCTPTRSVLDYAVKCLKLGISTVDSYDIHQSIYDLKVSLGKVAKENAAVSIISAGWDPGTDSMARALFEASAPNGITHTNFGPGMSMGHTVAVKAIKGVKNALSMTLPKGYSVHRRDVYVEVEAGASFEDIKNDILTDPYFINDETYVYLIDDVNNLMDKGHGVHMVRKGGAGKTNNQHFEWKMSIDNPALTSQIMTACARAATKQMPGAYTMLEIPIINLLYGDEEGLIRRLV